MKKLSPTMLKVLRLMRDGAELGFSCRYWRIGGDVLNPCTVIALRERGLVYRELALPVYHLSPAGRAAVADDGAGTPK